MYKGAPTLAGGGRHAIAELLQKVTGRKKQYHSYTGVIAEGKRLCAEAEEDKHTNHQDVPDNADIRLHG